MTAGDSTADAADDVARLTWQVPDPAELSQDLRRRLEVPVVPGARTDPGAGADAAFLVPLEIAVLELVPWRHEAPGDEPQPAGRLVLEPVPRGWVPPLGSLSLRSAETSAAGSTLTLAGIGWATIELDRAARELAPWLRDAAVATARGAGVPGGTDPHLGARTMVRATAGLPGEAMVLAEPTTEGRLAASLARHGEGPVALYLRPREGLDAWIARARARRVAVSARRDGPLGPQVLVLPAADSSAVGHAAGAGSAMAGPHVIVVGRASPVSGDRSPSSWPAPGGTIRS